MGPDPNSLPEWFSDLLVLPDAIKEKELFPLFGEQVFLDNGIVRAVRTFSEEQKQTEEVFGFKWHQRSSFETDASLKMMQEWSNERYGHAETWFQPRTDRYLILDAGCGAAYTGLQYFYPILDRIHYIGADISNAVDVAQQRMHEAGADAAFMQSDLNNLPLPHGKLDAIFAEGVLHHTDSTRDAIISLTPLLKPGGLFMFYVYRRKGPIREFTDDYIREKIQSLPPEEAWKAMEAISHLGKSLGELNIQIEIPKNIDFLGIEAGKIDLQRFFYWHVLKCFYRPDYSLEEMNHINFDWYAPKNAFRQTPEEVEAWCLEADLEILHRKVEEAGITIVGRKKQD